MLLPPWDDYALLPGPYKTAVACLSPGSGRRDRSGSQGRPIAKVFDESEFLSPYGPRALSAYHREHPCVAEHAIRAADKPFLAYRAHVKTVQTRC